MKHIFGILALAIGLSGCNKEFIQIFETDASNSTRVNDFFVFENDTVRITYNFWFTKGVMSFQVFNKLDKPIYINWKNSSFIHNGNKLNYWVDEEFTDMAAYYGGYFYKGPLLPFGMAVNEGVSVSRSTKSKPEKVTFIPPKSNYHRNQFILYPIAAFDLGKTPQQLTGPRLDNPKKETTVYQVDFPTASSPLIFRNYLALSFSESSEDFKFVDNPFSLKSVKEMDIRHFRGKKMGKDENGNDLFPKPLKKPTSFYIKIDGDKSVEYKKGLEPRKQVPETGYPGM
jgi:hypothetical protein